MKCYVLVTGDLKRRQSIIDYIDKVPEIAGWRIASGGIFLLSEKDEEWLTDRVHEEFPKLVFLIVPLDFYSVQGYQARDTWEFIFLSSVSTLTSSNVGSPLSKRESGSPK